MVSMNYFYAYVSNSTNTIVPFWRKRIIYVWCDTIGRSIFQNCQKLGWIGQILTANSTAKLNWAHASLYWILCSSFWWTRFYLCFVDGRYRIPEELWNVFLHQCVLSTDHFGGSAIMWEGYIRLCKCCVDEILKKDLRHYTMIFRLIGRWRFWSSTYICSFGDKSGDNPNRANIGIYQAV
jgi:hypothetical protein